MNCRLCLGYVREKNACPGCWGDDSLKMKSCAGCQRKNCEKLIAGGYDFCYQCESYPCASLKGLDKRYRTKYGMSMLENLASIQEIGIDAFMANENERWACPDCGAMLCVHRPACIVCGSIWQA